MAEETGGWFGRIQPLAVCVDIAPPGNGEKKMMTHISEFCWTGKQGVTSDSTVSK